jgi:hypothetical protein
MEGSGLLGEEVNALQLCRRLETMKKWALATLLMLLTVAVPALAGEVYVPYASNASMDGILYRTKVWITNSGTVGRHFDVRFIATDTDGSADGAADSFNLIAGGTLLITSVAPEGGRGMLEISGAEELVVTARLEAFDANGGLVSSANVPVAAVGNVFAAGTTADIQGLEITQRGSVTDFGLMNLSRSAAQCTVKAFQANGSQIAQTAILSFLPLSARHFDGVLSILGEELVSDARINVTCDQQFFPYALVFKPGGPDTNFVTAAGPLVGDLVPGGGGDGGGGSGGGGGQGDTVTFDQPGAFFTARQGDSFRQLTVPLVAGVQYSKATIEFDLATGRFPDGLFAGIMGFRRNDRTLYCGLLVRGDRQKTIIDLGVTDDLIQGGNGGPWTERSNFHVFLQYDTEARLLTFKLYKNGNLVQTLTGHTNHNDLSTSGHVVTLDFGLSGIADGAYFPPIGWTYSNLHVTFEP